MLSDDIESGIVKGVRMTGNAVKSAVRGALIFAAAALVISAVVFAAPGLAAATSMTLGMGLANGVAALAGGAMAAASHGAMLLGAAKVGAVIMGVTSFLPGKDEWFGLKKLVHRRRRETDMAQGPTVIHQHQQVQSNQPVMMRESAPQPQYVIVREPASHATPQPSPDYHTVVVQQSAPGASAAEPTPVVVTQTTNASADPVIIQAAPSVSAEAAASVQQPTAPAASAVPPAAPAPTVVTEEASAASDNPYYKPGLGARLMQKGDTAGLQAAAARS
jgi:hypothetical protein